MKKIFLSNATLDKMKLALVKGGVNDNGSLFTQDSTCAQESTCGSNLVSSCPNNNIVGPGKPTFPPIFINPGGDFNIGNFPPFSRP